jgi:hypothetical protein
MLFYQQLGRPDLKFQCMVLTPPDNLDIWTLWSRLFDHDNVTFNPDAPESGGIFPLNYLRGVSASFMFLGKTDEQIQRLRSGTCVRACARKHVSCACHLPHCCVALECFLSGLTLTFSRCATHPHPHTPTHTNTHTLAVLDTCVGEPTAAKALEQSEIFDTSVRRIWCLSPRPDSLIRAQKYNLPYRFLSLVRPGKDIILLPKGLACGDECVAPPTPLVNRRNNRICECGEP